MALPASHRGCAETEARIIATSAPLRSTRHQPPAALLVDLDNTLYNYRQAAAQALDALARDLQADFGLDAAIVVERYRVLAQLPPEEPPRYGLEARRRRIGRLLTELLPGQAFEVDRYVARYGESLLASIRWFAGARQALLELAQRLPVLVVSEGSNDIARPIMDKLGLDAADWPLLCSFDHGVSKRDGSVYHLALQWLHQPTEAVVMVGDNWTLDILGAAAAGIDQVWIAPDAADLPLTVPQGYLGRAAGFAAACRLLFPDQGAA